MLNKTDYYNIPNPSMNNGLNYKPRLPPIIHRSNPAIPNTKLSYRLIESTSEDFEYPLLELNKGRRGKGWLSARYCQFPQSIYIQFNQPVNVKQINILIHEKNIPSQIKFYTYCPISNDEIIKNYRSLKFTYIGFIKMDSNQRSNYRAREFRKVYIDTNAFYIKLELGKNYLNRYNIFNQVGLISLEFFGQVLPLIGNSKKINQFYLNESMRPPEITDEELEEICGDKLNELKNEMKKNIEEERYDICKIIKGKTEKIRLYGKKIHELEYQKQIAVNNEDFDKANELKNLSEKMRMNLENIDKDPNISNTFINDINNIEEQINENGNKTINNNSNEINDKSISLSGDFDKKLNISHQKKITQDNFMSYDDIIIPAVLKKINKEKNEILEESGEAAKGNLEDIDNKLLNEYSIIVKVIGEEGLKKLFSKHILWKEEGFDFFLEKMPEMFSSQQNSDSVNKLITLIMKLVMIFLEEKHPNIIIKTLIIIKNLLDSIKNNKTKLNIDLNITDNMLIKIKKKLGDVNPKVRNKVVELYSYMLTLDFCDYNNLINELIEEELKHHDDIKIIPKSSKVIMKKLEILNSAFDDFNNSIKAKRTDMESFPSSLVLDYLIMNVTHSKSEIRKYSRMLIGKFINIFGIKNMKKKLEKIEGRELLKLVNENQSLKELFPNLTANGMIDKSSLDVSNNNLNVSGRNKSKSKTKIENKIKCNYCQKEIQNKENLQNHFLKECQFYITCENCNQNIEVKKLINHRLNECKDKEKYEMCKRCKEAILKELYDKHVKDNKCNPAKNPNSSARCPLCHKDIVPPGDKGFINHLCKEGCGSHNRKKN